MRLNPLNRGLSIHTALFLVHLAGVPRMSQSAQSRPQHSHLLRRGLFSSQQSCRLNPLNRGLSIHTDREVLLATGRVVSQSAQSRPQHSHDPYYWRVVEINSTVSIRSIAASAFTLLLVLLSMLVVVRVSIRSIAASAFTRDGVWVDAANHVTSQSAQSRPQHSHWHWIHS